MDHKTIWQLLAELELLSHGATMKIDANRVHGSKERAAMPAGESNPPHLEFRERYLRAFSEKSRREIVAEAEKCLADWRKTAPPKEPEWGSYHWKVLVANDDRPREIQVRHWGISRQTIATYRRKYRKDAA